MDLFIPTYFPEILHFAVMIRSNAPVMEVCDNYQKQTLRSRTYITHAQGKLGLFVPVKHQKTGLRQKFEEVRTEDSFSWASNHWKSIQTAYRTSPFFEFYEDDLADLFMRDDLNLQHHNLRVIERIMALMEVDFHYTTTEKYQAEFRGQDYRHLSESKYNLRPEFTGYTQVFGTHHGFLSNCSILDALFNLGPQTSAYLESIPMHAITG